MKAAAKYKLEIDAAMIIAMLLLMAYGLVGEKSHEWIGRRWDAHPFYRTSHCKPQMV